MKLVTSLFLMFLPFRLKRAVMNRFLGYKIDNGAHISFAFVQCDYLEMAAGSRIGRLCRIGRLSKVIMGLGSEIGARSAIFAEPIGTGLFPNFPMRTPELTVGDHTALLGVAIDCQDSVRVGKFTTISGSGTKIFTHGIDVIEGIQSVAPVSIGDYCMIGANTLFLKGTFVPNRCVVGAGSIVIRKLETEETLYVGAPATARRKIPSSAKYFHRPLGAVD